MKRYIILLLFILLVPLASSQNTCGNHKLESDENCINCHLDAGCKINYFCGNNGLCTERTVPPYILLLMIPITIILIISLYLISKYTEQGFELKEVLSMFSILLLIVLLFTFLYLNISAISSKINPVTQNAKVLIDNDVAKNVNTILINASHEFVLCLKGNYGNGIFEVTGFSSPPVMESTNVSVKYGSCWGFNIIGTIHSHLDGKCGLSGVDKFTFGKKGHLLTAVVCGKNEFGIYSQENLENELYYVIKEVKVKRDYDSTFAYSIIAIISIFMVYYMIYLQEEKKDFYSNLSKIYWKLSKDEKSILKCLIEEKKLSFEELGILTEFSKEKLNKVLKRLENMHLISIDKMGARLNTKKRW